MELATSENRAPSRQMRYPPGGSLRFLPGGDGTICDPCTRASNRSGRYGLFRPASGGHPLGACVRSFAPGADGLSFASTGCRTGFYCSSGTWTTCACLPSCAMLCGKVLLIFMPGNTGRKSGTAATGMPDGIVKKTNVICGFAVNKQTVIYGGET